MVFVNTTEPKGQSHITNGMLSLYPHSVGQEGQEAVMLSPRYNCIHGQYDGIKLKWAYFLLFETKIERSI